MSHFIGPALPPDLQRKLQQDEREDTSRNEQVVGPVQSSELQTKVETSHSHDAPHPQERVEVLLPHLRTDNTVIQTAKDADEYGDVYGPALPPGMRVKSVAEVDDSDEDSIVGPMPTTVGEGSMDHIQQQLENRALRMKRKLAGETESEEPGVKKRESWMLELPSDRAADFGLGPRQFRTRAPLEAGDRTVWTDTPADRHRKNHSQGETSAPVDNLEKRVIDERNRRMQCLVEEHSGERQRSLLESHQKKLKMKKKEKGKMEERRPFDRNIDLQANRFDEAQKKAIFKKAQLLNDRFASGQSKFL